MTQVEWDSLKVGDIISHNELDLYKIDNSVLSNNHITYIVIDINNPTMITYANVIKNWFKLNSKIIKLLYG